MTAWADPAPTVEQRAAQNARLPVSAQLHGARPGAVAVAPEGAGYPAIAAIRTGDETRPWELTGLPNRYTTGDLLFISSSWRLLEDPEAAR